MARTARRLDAGLAGRVLTRTDFRVPALATLDLAGWTYRGTDTVGKHLLGRFNRDDRTVTLHSHLGMDGVWQYLPPGRRWARPAHQCRAVLEAGRVGAAAFAMKTFELLDPAGEQELRERLGPDLLDAGAGLSPAADALGGTDRPVAAALLDQTVVAGLGTVLVSEVCFLRGVHPLTPSDDVDATRLLAVARKVITASVVTGTRVTTGNTRAGQQYWVYGRDGRACRRCGTPVQRVHVGPAGQERGIFFCPSCQPLG